MPNRYKIRLEHKAYYWKARLLFDRKVTFRVFRRLYTEKHKLREEDYSASILFYSLRSVLGVGVYAALFVVLMEVFSHMAKSVRFTISTNDLGVLLSAVVTVTGVFLGLYFTALSAVAGNLFMRAPEDLQQLFLRDRKGKQYVKTLAMTIIVGVYYLLLRSFGYNVGFVGPIVIALLSLYAVVRFLALGAQTFYFIHPGEASSTLTGDAAQAIINATANGFGWKQMFLQHHYKKQAKQAIKTLSSLVDFGVEAIKLSDQQLLDIAKYTGGLLGYYLERKKKIPTESEWYDTKQRHQNWLLADSTEITMALNTGTFLSPKSSKDKLWFEDECLDVILRIFDIFVAAGKWDYAIGCIETVIHQLDKISSNFYIDEAKLIVQKVGESISRVSFTSDIPANEEGKRGQLGLADSYDRVAIGLLVGLIRYLDKRDCATLNEEIRQTKWRGKASIYASALPGNMLPKLEANKKGLDVELAMEGHRVSPDWYMTTITTQEYLQELKQFYDYLKSMQKDVFEDRINDLVSKEKYLHAAHLTEGWLEFSSKMLSCGSMMEKLMSKCAINKKVQDLPWPEFNHDVEKAALVDGDKKANDKSAELLPILASLPRNNLEELPDYFGQSYTFSVMAAYEAAFDNDKDRLKKIFPAVLIGALKAHDLLREETEGWSNESKIIFSSEPLEDLLTLSGFIKIYSELYENDGLWKVCETVWGKYLSTANAKDIIQMLVAFTTYRDGVYKIMPKATLRQNWDFKLRDKLEELGLSAEEFPNPFSRDENAINHNSPLIRVLARRTALLDYEARTIFYITYLKNHQGAEGTNFPDRLELERSINRESGSEDN